MDKGWRYEIPDSVVFTRVCDAPVLAVTREEYEETDVAACLLNETGEFLWKQIQEDRPVDEIIRNTAEFFGEDPAQIGPEVEAFLRSLESQHMLRRIVI